MIIPGNEKGNELFTCGICNNNGIKFLNKCFKFNIMSKQALRLAWKFDIRMAAEIPFPETSAMQNPVLVSESFMQS